MFVRDPIISYLNLRACDHTQSGGDGCERPRERAGVWPQRRTNHTAGSVEPAADARGEPQRPRCDTLFVVYRGLSVPVDRIGRRYYQCRNRSGCPLEAAARGHSEDAAAGTHTVKNDRTIVPTIILVPAFM
jgi:hypothetical protein